MSGRIIGRPDADAFGLKRPGVVLLCVLAVLGLAAVVLGFMDDATIVSPSVADLQGDGAAVGMIAGLAVAPFMAWAIRGSAMWRRIVLGLTAGLVASGAIAVGFSSLVDVVEGSRLFPPETSVRARVSAPILRAWRTHGKSAHQTIVTGGAYSAMLDVTSSDYEVMAGPGRDGPDRVSEPGRYCAMLSVERSGAAVRILHAGSYDLPSGTVVPCGSAGSRAS